MAHLIISGGSRGLGLAMVERYLAAGHAVASFARHESDGIAALEASHPDWLMFRAIDATDGEAVAELVAEAHKRFGSIAGLVNNAAIGQDGLLSHMAPEKIDEVIAVNLAAPIKLIRAVVRHMMVDGGGRIVNISSLCATHGFAGLSVYAATKGALEALTRALAVELGGRGIQVNCIAPGFFASEMSGVLRAEQIEAIRRHTPLQRLIEPGDILPYLDVLLLGPAAVTGQVIRIDGGYSA